MTSRTVDDAREPARGRADRRHEDQDSDAYGDATAPNVRQLPFALFGSKSAPRPFAPEPSLLPHLARLVPNWAVQNVLDLAWDYGRIGNDRLPPWIALWEATFGGLSTRYFDLTHHYMGPISSVTQLDVDIARAGYYNERIAGQALLERLSFSETGHNLIASKARLAALMDDRFVLDFMDEVDPRDLDAESARSILAVASSRLSSVSRDWVNLALDETNFEPHFSRLAHLAPELPREMIGEVVADVAEEIETIDPPEWFRALVISRLSPHARNPNTFLSHGSDDRLWAPFLDRLGAAKAPKGQFGDVLRAHPSAVDLLRHTPPQEIAAEAVSYIRGADDVEDAEEAEASAVAPSSVPRERTLQASVYIDGTEHSDTAFVSGVRHLVAVSFSRTDLVPVNAAFGHQIRSDSAATTKLIVRLVFNGLVAESPLLLPLDPAVDSAPATFAITPGGAQESLTARIIIYAPNGIEIVESVVLTGDVVPTVEAARFHGNQLQLDRRVHMRRPLTEVTSAITASVLVDQYVAISANTTGVRVADVRSLHKRLGQLTELIEASAATAPSTDPPLGNKPQSTTGDNEFERAIADRSGDARHKSFVTLATELAANGHALRVAVDQHLGDFSREREIQLVQTNPGFDLPLELLYSGPEPSVVTPFCDAWARSRQPNGGCPTCTDDPTSAVCLSHFWGTTKNIDRRTGVRPSIRTAAADALPPADAAILAASRSVDPTISSAIHGAAENALGEAIAAVNWNDWRLAAARNDGVLIALVNPDGAAGKATGDQAANSVMLEVGGDHVGLSDIDPAFVGKETGQPGPITVLIPTGVSGSSPPESAYAAIINHVGAPFVISALARSTPAHAGDFAQATLSALASVRSTSLRDSVREIRRELLLRSVPAGFLVVGYGDGDWRRSY